MNQGRVGYSINDALPAVGPLIMMGVFAFVLYALLVPINLFVIIGIGLIYWPLYEFTGLIADQAIMAIFRHRSVTAWLKFRNSFFPLLALMVVVGLVFFSQWFFLVVFAQCLHLVADPPGEDEQKEGCLVALVTTMVLVIVFLAATLGGARYLSLAFNFPNVTGPLQLLPGMLIIGIGYYFVMAILGATKRPALRFWDHLGEN